MKLRFFLILFLLLPLSQIQADSLTAHQVLEKTLTLMKNKGGVKFDYTFKLSNFFNRYGTFVFKGNKSLSWNKKEIVWADGTTVWALDIKKNRVRLLEPGSSRHGLKGLDEQLDLILKSYNATLSEENNYYKVSLKANNSKVDAKEATMLIDKKTFHPVQVRVKIFFLWGTINISKFQHVNYNDNIFTFPRNKYPTAKIIDKRKSKTAL